MKNYTLLLFFFWSIHLQSQTLSNFIKQNAIDLKRDSIFDIIKDYKCVMLGEVHGTKEAAGFLEQLIKLASKNGKKIIVGLEIPGNDMQEFIKKPTTNNLKKTLFFKDGYGDGRNNEAWFKLIDNCKSLKNVQFCFFDGDSDEYYSSEDRDKVMFDNIVSEYKKDTARVVYTISGNIHNKITPYRKKKVLGCYLVDLFTEKNVLSINHIYGDGTAYNRVSGTLKKRDIKGQTGYWSTSTPLENYFLPRLPKNFQDGNNAIIYTKTITASVSMSIKSKASLSKKRRKKTK